MYEEYLTIFIIPRNVINQCWLTFEASNKDIFSVQVFEKNANLLGLVIYY
jgi:hypothetical protein